MDYMIEVENVKCGGCASTIEKTLLGVSGVAAVDVEIADGRITVQADSDLRDGLVAVLLKAGYPEKGSVEGLKAARAKARSYVSCAVGKFNK